MFNNRMIMRTVSFLFKVILVGFVGLTLHILLKNMIDPVIARAMSGVIIKKPPYDLHIVSFAYLTALLPGFGMIALYHLFTTRKKYFDNKGFLIKGSVFSLLILLSQGQLIRQPVMNFLVGDSSFIVFVMFIKKAIPILAMGVLTAFLIDYRRGLSPVMNSKKP